MGELTLTQKEQARLQIPNGVLAHQISAEEAAEVLGLSQRQVWRILSAYRKEGAAAVAHGNRGRSPANTLPQETRDRVILLARNSYPGVNHMHLAELLAEREEVALARTTVRRILLGAGLPSPRRRRPPRHRIRRQRMPQEAAPGHAGDGGAGNRYPAQPIWLPV
jgi:transposase